MLGSNIWIGGRLYLSACANLGILPHTLATVCKCIEERLWGDDRQYTTVLVYQPRKEPWPPCDHKAPFPPKAVLSLDDAIEDTLYPTLPIMQPSPSDASVQPPFLLWWKVVTLCFFLAPCPVGSENLDDTVSYSKVVFIVMWSHRELSGCHFMQCKPTPAFRLLTDITVGKKDVIIFPFKNLRNNTKPKYISLLLYHQWWCTNFNSSIWEAGAGKSLRSRTEWEFQWDTVLKNRNT